MRASEATTIKNSLIVQSDGLSQSANAQLPKCKNCTLEERVLIAAMRDNPKITQAELAKTIGKSTRTVKACTSELQKKGLLAREGGKRNGWWNVLVDRDV